MRILGIETTCDETGVAVVENGTQIITNLVATSSQIHRKFGGVVPEIAARAQVELIIPLLKQSNINQKTIEAISVAYGPGLVGSLLIGVEVAKSLAVVWGKPLIGVNHLVAHFYANWIISNEQKRYHLITPKLPAIALVVSGGHTDLVLVKGHGNYKWLGGTLDDAAGEVFDKVARALGLGYPGGPAIDRLSLIKDHNTHSNVHFPRPMINSNNFNFSFSGLKTSVVNYINKIGFKNLNKAEISTEFQNAICEVLVIKTIKAASIFKVKSIIIGGGVAANSQLRFQMSNACLKLKIELNIPKKEFSVDNGAMVAATAFYNFKQVDPLKLQANPGLHFD